MGSRPDNSGPTKVRFGVLAWLCSLSMITYIDRVCIMQVQGDMQRDLGLTTQQFSWTFAAFALAYALFEIPTGWLGDRIGARKVLARIVLCWLFFTALTGLVPRWDATSSVPLLGVSISGSLAILLVVRFLFGAGEAGAYPTMARAARGWFPFAERGRAQGLIWTFGRWGGSLAPLLVVALAYPFDALGYPGWRAAFLQLGLLGVVWVVGFTHFFRDTPDEHPSVNEAERRLIVEGSGAAAAPAPLSWSAVVSSPTLWFLTFMYFCSNAGWSFFITFVKEYLEKDLGLTGWRLHTASGLPLFVGGFGCLLGGMVTDRQVHIWGRRWGRTLQGVLAYTIGGCLFVLANLLTRWEAKGLALTAICLASFFKDFAIAASWATTIDIGHRYSGTVAGIMNSIGNLGTMVSAPIVAWLATDAGTSGKPNWSMSLFYYAVMFFIASVCWLFIDPRRVIVYAPADHQRLFGDTQRV
jgi:MFS family permease